MSWRPDSVARAKARLDAAWVTWLMDDLPVEATARAQALDERLHRARWPRYRDGWRRYLERIEPPAVASIVIDNEDFAAPVVLSA